jgi:hypothetical protein
MELELFLPKTFDIMLIILVQTQQDREFEIISMWWDPIGCDSFCSVSQKSLY